MFGRDKTKKKRRWFFKVRTEADALEANKIAYQTFYAVAVIQAVVMAVLALIDESWSAGLFDPVLMVLLALGVHKRQSRTAAVCLMGYAVVSLLTTAATRFGVTAEDAELGGGNVILAVIAIYAAYMGLQGTFRYHALRKSRVLWGRVLAVAVITLGYAILAAIVAYAVLIVVLPETAWEGDSFDELIGTSVLVVMVAVALAGGWRKLPGTGRLRVLAEPLDEV